MRSLRFIVLFVVLAVSAVCASAQTADDLEASVTTHFTISGGGPPWMLAGVQQPANPNGDLAIAARLVHADMVGLGYTPGTGTIDGRNATTPIPVLWRGCTATGGGKITPTGDILDNAGVDGVILLATGFDGTAGNPNGTNAYARAQASVSSNTVFAVGGLGFDNGSTNSNGGWAEAYELDPANDGLGAYAWGGKAAGTGTGGYAIAESNSSHALAFGGDSDTGNGGPALGDATGVGTGGAGEAHGGNTASPGDGGAATATGQSVAWAVGGNTTGSGNGGPASATPVSGTGVADGGSTTGSGNGGNAVVPHVPMNPNTCNGVATGGNSGTGSGGVAIVGNAAAAGQRMTGTGSAFGGSGATGGLALVFSVGAAVADGGDGNTNAGGSGTANSSGASAQASGGDGDIGGGAATATSGGTGNADAKGGNGVTTGNGGDALADSSAGTGVANATGGDANAASADIGGSARAIGPTQGDSGWQTPGTWAGATVTRS